MCTRFLMMLTLLATYVAGAAVRSGENVLLNGRFETDQTDLPLYWAVNAPNGVVSWRPSDGPGGTPCMSFRNPKGRKAEVTLRQYGLQLVSNGLYRVSLMVRTKDFASRNHGAVAIDQGWYWAGGVHTFPANTNWTRLSREFHAKKSSNGQYSVAVYAIDFSGDLDVADFQLEALDETAQRGTMPSCADKASKLPRLLPWGVNLREIPRATRKATFKFFGKVAEGESPHLVLEVGGKTVRTPIAVDRGETTVALPTDCPERGRLAARVEGASGVTLCSESFAYRLVDPVDTTGHRRLNNFVTEVLSARGSGTSTFTTTRDGWVFISASAPSVTLDGRKVIDTATPRHETFRNIPYGRHTLKVEGAAADAPVVVRQIAEIFNYCPGVNSKVAENKPYDWEFQKKYVHPAVTTQNGGNIPEEHRAWFRDQGYLWLANQMSTKLVDENDLTRRLEKGRGLVDPCYDGCTCDEQFFGQPEMLDWYTHGLKAFANPSNRLIYTWIVGKPGTPGVDHEFLSASREVSEGYGKVLFEAYCRTKATEAEANAYLANYVTDTLEKYRKWCPGIESSVGIAFGNFNQIPILSLTHHPEVDYKYYLDMQLHLAATDPAFAGLGCTGYWGSYYADRELHRWSFALLRHYCVEGGTDLLSRRFGFTYLPGHLVNGDFRGSLDGWTATGNVSVDSHKGLGSRSQNRWGGNGGLGDTFAVLTKGEGVDTLKQTVKGLVPGRMYCLQYATFDVKDVKANRIAPRVFAVRGVLGAAAEVDASRSWVHVDRRTKGRYAHNDGVARINLHHIVFTARASEIPLTFDDAEAKPGEALGLNCVSLNPFYGEL